MKTSLLMFILLSLNFCNGVEEKENTHTGVKTEKAQIEKSEISTLTTDYGINRFYAAKIGKKHIQLLKTSKNTLAFVVPDLPQRLYVLGVEPGTSRIKRIETNTMYSKKIQAVGLSHLSTNITVFERPFYKSHQSRKR